jgi:hypothetical protein
MSQLKQILYVIELVKEFLGIPQKKEFETLKQKLNHLEDKIESVSQRKIVVHSLKKVQKKLSPKKILQASLKSQANKKKKKKK